MEYRWIYKKIVQYKNTEYINYVVIIKNKYLYSSMNYDYCINFIKNYAKKHGINHRNILRTNKHPRI